ncbi:N-acetyltransferase [Quadrisphaera sp. DSM 44207]|uniref:GNAT family N-acetyltransferase n=1 Tax=Quadrisphaera sp. DSM 44207 TaxID=1881057 RepID=UPI000884F2FB|nr:N-acetyltransferase [Quadrisphaera sp. DSM 44207]SDQ05269.1 Ribosomal protein S18 acetylase RimI [Quadrisphaera sp. DSM 44207]
MVLGTIEVVTSDASSGRCPLVRRARADDAAALVRLRAVMFEDMGVPVGTTDAPWRGAAEAWFRGNLQRPDHFAAFVVEDPVTGAVSAACGICDARAPGPRGLSGVRGHVFSVATEPEHRRRGHARACLTALLSWFHDDTAAEAVELAATPDGAQLYTALGFREHGHPTMRLGLHTTTEVLL